MTVRLPWDLLAVIHSADPGRPRLTWYDDEPGPTNGERIELSARVLINWVSKAGNLLQDDLAAEPDTRVWLDLPTHWRAIYWALATWAVGATVVLTDGVRAGHGADADVVVTSDPATAAAARGDAVLVSLPALARSHPDASAAGAIDEARELSTHGDEFSPFVEPESESIALVVGDAETPYADLVVARPDWGSAPRVALSGALDDTLVAALSAWALDGSVILSRGTDAAPPDRLRSEGVTLNLQEP
ncbi:MAG: TIGR03089 family protein [Micrococcales bacterium]|nr:TIGR03089 family protein [Micrococcales bacterium]